VEKVVIGKGSPPTAPGLSPALSSTGAEGGGAPTDKG